MKLSVSKKSKYLIEVRYKNRIFSYHKRDIKVTLEGREMEEKKWYPVKEISFKKATGKNSGFSSGLAREVLHSRKSVLITRLHIILESEK
jgi:hypothetical protein